MDFLSLTTANLAVLEKQFNKYLKFFSTKNYYTLAALKGFRNGIVYGVKIRAPHALVMALLFGKGTLLDQFKYVLKITRLHAWNLGRFVLGYKIIMGLLRQRYLIIGPARYTNYKHWHSFLAAFIVGYFVFGKENAVNTQINLYLLSRVIYGLAKLAVEKDLFPRLNFSIFPWFSAIVWGVVLWLFENHSHVLQKSLKKSMTYLYHESNYWTNIRNFILGTE